MRARGGDGPAHDDMSEDLRARLRAGDRDAFAELYEQHARAVHLHAHRLTGDWSAAEEVMADTFLDAWRHRARLEPEGGAVLPWLLGMATNKARNARRGTGRRLAFLSRRPAPEPVPDFAEETAGRLDDARTLDAVREVYGRLRRAEREVLALCVWSGLDYAEAAQALGVPVGTVRSRLSRARARLRRLVEERLVEERLAEERLAEERLADESEGRAEGRGEPSPGRGEVRRGDAFAALTLTDFQEGTSR